jgi:DNA topoisomerase VI subunit A
MTNEELIINFARILRTCKTDELKEMSEMNKTDWLLNSENKERRLSYSTWVTTIQTVLFIKENSERYSLFDKDSFFEAYSFC